MMATEISIPTLTGSVEAADTGLDSCNGTK